MVTKIHWVTPLPKDKTGHIDMMAKIIRPNEVIVSDSIYKGNKEVLDKLANKFADLGYKVHRILNAENRQKMEDETRTYANSLIIDKTAFLPTYSDDPWDISNKKDFKLADEKASTIYENLGYKVVPVDCSKIIHYNGAVHCLTKQVSR